MSSTDVLPHDAPGLETPVLWTARLLSHVRKPENLITYLVLSAWMKFMGVSAYIPTVTVG